MLHHIAVVSVVKQKFFACSCCYRIWAAVLPLLLFVGIVLCPAPAEAMDYMVTNLNDSGAGSLRQAISDASDTDSIVFGPGMVGVISLKSPLPDLKSVTFEKARYVTLSYVSTGVDSGALNVASGKTISGFLPRSIQASGGSYPAGITALGSLTLDEDLSGSIATTNDKFAFGLFTYGLTLNKGLSGSISAFSSESAAAGMYSSKHIIFNEDLSGSVLAEGANAIGLQTDGSLILNGDLSGSVVAIANSGLAYGLKSLDKGIAIQGLTGSVAARSAQDSAYGLFARESISLGSDLSGSVEATAERDIAFALKSEGNMIFGGGLSGVVSASAGGEDAMGLFAWGDMIFNGDLSGSVAATAGVAKARGLFALQDLIFNGDLTGSVRAVSGGHSAFGISSDDVLRFNGKLSGSVAATAAGGDAYGVWGHNSFIMTDDLSGSVSAFSGVGEAYGVKVTFGGISLQNMSGTITATADENIVYGMYSYQNDISIAGDLSGTVLANAGGHTSMGLNSHFGAINNGVGGAANISGSVSANANGLAVAVGGNGGLNLNVTGTLLASDSSGLGEAYAVRAGCIDWKTGDWIDGGANDSIMLGNGANVLGRIELGGGTNLLTLDGAGTLNGAVNSVTTMTKTGSGTWATSGGIHTNDLTVQAGTLNVNILQRTTPTIVVDNNFINNGEVLFSLDGLVASGSTFTALSSKNLSGLGSYSSDSIFMAADVVGNNVNLTKKSYMDMTDGSNSNSQARAAYLDPLIATATGDLADILVKLESSSSKSEFNNSLNQLGGLPTSGIISMSIDTAYLVSLATQTRMAELRSYQIMMAEKNNYLDPDEPESWPMVASAGDLAGLMKRDAEVKPNGVHMRVLGRTGGMDTHGGYDGYDYESIIFSGGYDRVIMDGFLAGISGGYAQTDADYKDTGGSDSQLGSYSLGLYGSWFKDNWYVDTIFAGAYNEYDMNRPIPFVNRTATADSIGYTMSAKTAGGYRFETGDYGLTPMLSMEYTRFHQDGYIESGAGAANLSVEDINSNFLASGLGVKIDRSWETEFGQIIPEISAMWMHEWLTQDRNLTVSMTGMPGTALSQTSAKTAKDSCRFGLGIRAINNKGMSFTLRYQGDIEKHAASQSLMCEAQIVF
ncbi:outer membrane autotransporter barrel domain-containing protein [Maridesulfovibrio ferrireducens]|uniref:Outer membrane autotransporter barrel domain-containing protein n=1 Tax=Maridesulfovibrio ferrireducens TaxID=246191 RepID=A0A1G9HI33_9BACT|nr:autotransporter outer membrane beta-barrel domain-containing protein [Maridesulfovibrio ferrireducens]SDL12668.1 outer membrane autotransporter barrel domain-containing protein [Maridesulfovibrio ferrireducens]